jgi:glycosyltransferase involved in cell wall biosynthesis
VIPTPDEPARSNGAAPTPRVSVVIPSFENARFIEQTVHSVLDQTFTDFELVISDHSSTDGTWELLQQFADDPRVRLTQVAAGGGAPANWTAVTAQARGELLKLVCGDDLLYPTALAEQVAAFDAYPEAVLVSALRDIVDAEGRPLLRARGLQGLSGLVPGDRAVRRTVAAGTNVFGEPMCILVRRSALIAAGGWDARFPYLIDQATFARVLRRGPMVALRRPLAAFRVSDQQWSVGLARRQAAHAREFHRTVAREAPGLLTTRDRVSGDVRATATAYARRALYVALRLRSRLPVNRKQPDRHTPLDRIAQ